MTGPYDILALGDIVVDEFIRLKEASVHCNINNEACEICMRFADKVPFEAAYLIPAVGNSANAAVAAAKLGLKSALYSNLGDDQYGKDCLAALAQAGVASEFVRAHAGHPTNHHYVLWYHDERTILIKHEAYPYALPDVDDPKWLYLSSMGETSLEFHKTIEQYLESHPNVKVAFQPGTYQMRFGIQALAGIYRRTEIFVCNKEESQRILDVKEEDVAKLMDALHALGPKVVVVTDGKAGAYASVASAGSPQAGARKWFMPSYPDPKPPYERTGAGDAFTSTFVSALCLGLDIETALKWAPVNAMAVVQDVGAQKGLLTRAQIEEFLAKAPADYAPRPLPQTSNAAISA